jgi:hypothetical protein
MCEDTREAKEALIITLLVGSNSALIDWFILGNSVSHMKP